MLPASRSWLYAPVLWRAYATSTTQAKPQVDIMHRARFKVPTISTLRQEGLVYSDFLVLSGSVLPRFHTQLSLHAPAKHARRGSSTRIDYGKRWSDDSKHILKPKGDGETTHTGEESNKNVGGYIPFPGHSQGFLYLHRPPPESGLPRSASSIRFRCTPSLVETSSSYIASLKPADLKPLKSSKPRSKPLTYLPPSITHTEIYEAFKAGHDLTLPNGLPWSISVTFVAGRPPLEFIYLQLLEDKLFSESELQEYKDIYINTRHNRGSRLLYTLHDVFSVQFDKTRFEVRAATAKDVVEGENKKTSSTKTPRNASYFIGVFTDKRSKYDGKLPYTGTALVRFELAPSSNPKSPAVSLRIVKITTPVECIIPDYDGYINAPKEGELVTRGLLGEVNPWVCRLNPSVEVHAAMLPLVTDIRRTQTCSKRPF